MALEAAVPRKDWKTSRRVRVRIWLQRMVAAGAKPTSVPQLLCELQRDWDRTDTATEFSYILFGHAPQPVTA